MDAEQLLELLRSEQPQTSAQQSFGADAEPTCQRRRPPHRVGAVLAVHNLRSGQSYTTRTESGHHLVVLPVVAGLGSVVYDDRSFILYRQHGANAVGGAATLARRLRVRAERLLRRRLRLFGPEQLQELLRIHGPALPPRRRALLERHLEGRRRLRARLRLALGRDVVLQRSWEQALVRCLILGNRL